MDVWRYSDWAGWGQQVRDSQPHIWHWRDWIVESLNRDQPYDRMVVAMLAADEASPDDLDALRATGYLARNFKLLSREKWMQDVVDHTGQAFLGVTLGCARCHDHMYDPILQKEYYQVRAIFEPHQVRIDRVPGTLDTAKDGIPRAYDAQLDAKTLLFVRGDDRNPTGNPLSPGVPEALGVPFPEVKPVVAAARGRRSRPARVRDPRPARREPGRSSPRREVALDETRARHRRTPRRSSWRGSSSPWPRHSSPPEIAVERAEALVEQGQKGSEEWTTAAEAATTAQRIWPSLAGPPGRAASRARRGAQAAPGKRAEADKAHADAFKALAVAERGRQSAAQHELHRPRRGRPIPPTSTGRRLAFARWITDPSNPLTARVAVNHLWGRHFGRAIVPSVNDFGRNGQRPSHPALLDWLAAEFMERGWSMKAIHRLIVTSATYRQDSKPDAGGPRPRPGQHLSLAVDAPARRGRGRSRLPVRRRRQPGLDDGRPRHRPSGRPDRPAAQPLLPARRRKADGVPADLRRRGRDRVLPPQGEHPAPASPGAGQQRSVASSGPPAGPHAVDASSAPIPRVS